MNTEVLDPERLMTPDEAADVLRCSTSYIWKLCRDGKLKHLRKGNKILIRRQDLNDYIARSIGGGV